MSAGGTSATTSAYRELLARLTAGVFTPGSKLPGERALSSSFGISRTTLRQSLNALAEEGWLTASNKRGWYVRRSVVGEPPNTLLSFTEMATTRGLLAGSRILAQMIRPVEFDEAASLQVSLSSDVMELVRVRSLDDVPVCYDRAIVALSRVPQVEHAELENGSLYRFLHDVCGVDILRSSYSVHAALMGDRLAPILRAQPSDPALVADELTFDRNGVPIIRATLTYRADSYRFQANLLRQS